MDYQKFGAELNLAGWRATLMYNCKNKNTLKLSSYVYLLYDYYSMSNLIGQ